MKVILMDVPNDVEIIRTYKSVRLTHEDLQDENGDTIVFYSCETEHWHDLANTKFTDIEILQDDE